MFAGTDDVIQYEVVSGDTLSKIASRYGTTWQQIADDNGLENPDLIEPGDLLDISVAGSESSVSPVAVTPIAVKPKSSTSTSTWIMLGVVSLLAGAAFVVVKNKNKGNVSGFIKKKKA